MKPGVNYTNQKPNDSPVSGKTHSFDIWRKRGKSFEHQKHVGWFDFYFEGTVHQEMFLLARWFFVVTTGRFCSVERSKSAHNTRTIAEPGLINLPWQCDGAHCSCRCSSNFWRLKSWLCFLTLLCGLNLHLVIYSCFREWNRSYADVVSRISLKFKNTHWLSYTRFWRGFQQCRKLWTLCMDSNWVWFEGNNNRR